MEDIGEYILNDECDMDISIFMIYETSRSMCLGGLGAGFMYQRMSVGIATGLPVLYRTVAFRDLRI